jgi:hypothetical protein
MKAERPPQQERVYRESLPFKDQLSWVYADMFPEAFEPVDNEKQTQLEEGLSDREAILDDMELTQALDEYGIDGSSIEKEAGGRLTIPVKDHFGEKRLPEGYAYKGGAARSLLMRSLDVDPRYIPRDIDVVRVIDKEPYPGADDEVAKEFMPEDFETGHGVEVLYEPHPEDEDYDEGSDKFDGYFGSRDLTLNEVLATDESVTATRECVLDTVRHIIRLTDFEENSGWESGFSGAGPKMLSKILRFYAESIHRYGKAEIQNVADGQFERSFIKPFWLALQLDRACDVSSAVSDQFVKELTSSGQIPDDIQTVEEAASYLARLMKGDIKPFYFRHAPEEQFTAEAEWLEEVIDDKYYKKAS